MRNLILETRNLKLETGFWLLDIVTFSFQFPVSSFQSYVQTA
jgi:hypothetical protein